MSSKSLRIFLADDDDDDRFLFRDALYEISPTHQLVVANNGKEMMETLESEIPPLPQYLFLDINMPLKNGLDCLQDIKNIPILQPIPVIMFSTSTHEGHVKRAKELGAYRYVRKPKTFQGLKKLLQEIVNVQSEKNSSDTADFLITSF